MRFFSRKYIFSYLYKLLCKKQIAASYSLSWEQRKLGEMGQTYTGLSGKTKDDFGHGSGKFITYMNVFSNPVASSNMTERYMIHFFFRHNLTSYLS